MACIALIEEAVLSGARIEQACETLTLSPETFRRWKENPAQEDQRQGPHTPPEGKLTDEEKDMIVEVVNSVRFRDKSPWQIVPALADEGRYIASEASFYRIMRENNLLAHRGKSRPRRHNKPAPLIARSPNEIWSWDITYLLSPVAGQFYYLYLIMDVFSRKIVGWEVYPRECSEFASTLIAGICDRERIRKGQLVIHSDNGSPMKGATLLVTLDRLGVTPSRSRPRVSDDNPYSEALFKTLKYQPHYPDGPFENIDQARAWVAAFVGWYNSQHLHSEIRYVTPDSRHGGKDAEILSNRKRVYEVAKQSRPLRWSGNVRNWNFVEEVHLNPGKHKSEKKQTEDLGKLAANHKKKATIQQVAT